MAKLGAFAVILNEAGEVLLCHRTDMDLWNLPGGAVELGESPWDAVLRETREEIGVEAETERVVGICFKPGSDELVTCFACLIVSGVPHPADDESDDVKWFAPGEIPDNTSIKQQERIRDALEGLPGCVVRTQTGPSSRELLAEPYGPTVRP